MSFCERDFQREAREKLSQGRSVIVIAPTGLGKTRAAIFPFKCQNSPLLTTRLIYALPMRTLARGVIEELETLQIKATVHHGDEPESKFFSERAIVTTVDQYFTAFAGAPLSWASHLSHAAAGAILTSYSVFDEVHLLSPKRGLQLLFALLRLRQRWGLLSCVMTATLPPSATEFFTEFCGLEKIEVSQSDIKQRDGWRKVNLQLIGQNGKTKFEWEEVTSDRLCDIVRAKWDEWSDLKVNGPKKIIVFVNTVDRSVQVYRNIKESHFCSHVLLAHSRFTEQDRQRVEQQIQTYFGKDACQEEAILVSTQVAEAGLNISAPLVITELCPMDSLIQRAGRCQRFNMEGMKEKRGLVLVVKPRLKNWYLPYVDEIGVEKTKGKRQFKNIPIAEITRVALEEQINHNGVLNLNWEKEKELIERALDDAYRLFLSGSDRIFFEEVKGRPLGKAFQEEGGKKDGEE